MWKEGCKKTTEAKKHNETNKSFFDKLLKRRVRLFWVLSLVGRGTERQKHCLLSLTPSTPISCALVNSLCYVPSLHLSRIFRPIIAPTWDCTQDNVGIFDNMDCETETLFWINKQHSLELLVRNPPFFPLLRTVLLVIFLLFILGLLSSTIWVISEKALSFLDGDRRWVFPLTCSGRVLWFE